jgi:hypothetical protein
MKLKLSITLILVVGLLLTAFNVYLPIVSTAAGTPTPTTTRTLLPTETVQPTSTATNAPSLYGSRSNPYPIGYVANFTNGNNQNFTLTVNSVIRGSATWLKSHYDNVYIYPLPTPPGEEYVIVNISVNYISGPTDSILSISSGAFGIVSDNSILTGYLSIDIGILHHLDAQLFPGGSSLGYDNEPVYIDDPNPLSYFVDNTVYPYKSYYFSLIQ